MPAVANGQCSHVEMECTALCQLHLFFAVLGRIRLQLCIAILFVITIINFKN